MDEYRFDLSEPLDNSYKLLDVLGAGQDGVVLHIQNKRTEFEMALKLIDSCAGDQLWVEVNIASKSDLFLRCYGVFVSTNLPTEWLKRIQKKYVKKIMYGYFYEYFGISLFTWLDAMCSPVNKRTFMAMLFEIFYAIIWAHKNFGFVQNDLHMQNILVKPIRIVHEYEFGETKFMINNDNAIKIIDFDRIEIHSYKRFDFDDAFTRFVDYDLKREESNFSKLFEDKKDAYKMIENLERVLKDPNQPTENLLLIPEFDIFRASSTKESTKKRVKTMDCHVCGGVGVRALANRPSIAFCVTDACVLKMGDIVHMM